MVFDELFTYGDQNVLVPAHLNFGKFILDRIRCQGNQVALEDYETRKSLTYKELAQYTINMADALMKLGVRRGDIVAVGCERRFEFFASNVAIIFTGATYTPYDLRSGLAILKHKMSLTRPRYFICSERFWNMHKDILKNTEYIEKIIAIDDNVESLTSIKSLITCDLDINKFEPVQVQGQVDTACIFYSSGTTGMSKGVQITHLNCILASLPDQFKDECLQTAFIEGDWFHSYDTFTTYKFIALGRKIVFQPVVSPQTILKCIDNCKINIAFVVPSHINSMVKSKESEKYNLDSLQIMFSASSPLHKKTIEQIKFRFPELKFVFQSYGMTEAGELSSESWGLKGPKPGSVGMASPGITIKVVDPETREALGSNRRGEICIKGPVLMKGYIGTELSNFLDEQGFFNTGDLGYYDEDKYYYIVGRLTDHFTYEGDNVCPLELETILQLHPAVHEAGVIGKPEPIFGEEPTAFVVKQAGFDVTEKDLIDFVTTQVPPYMELRGGVRFVNEIPKNSRGKIMRQRLKEML